MDALASPASTLPAGGGPFHPTTTREPLLLRTTTHIPPYPSLTTKRSSFSLPNQHNSSSNLTTATSLPVPPLRFPSKPSLTTIRRRASTGYAAALLDVSRCHNTDDAVERDAGRFLRAIRSGVVRGTKEVEVEVEKGFNKHLVVLVRMLLKKGKKVEYVAEVLEEFMRLCDEVSGTRVVMVSSDEKMKEEELMGIAEKVRRSSGAWKVKVRHVVRQYNSPAFAVTPKISLILSRK